ncbi:MAG: pyridoxal phosphate-dependent aminotransferase [Aestuariivirgaceae bacterium]|nr:pyridoxal phosphate-dependent aminotransferase [Aestuariivirgaceae bacterium]
MRFASITQRLQGLGSDKWHVHIEGKRRLASGEPMLMLSIGEPDFKTPQAIVDVAAERLRAGRTRYSNGRGEADVLNALSAHYTARTGRPITTEQIIFLPGTQTALYACMMVLAEPGDEVLMPDPFYVSYDGIIAACGATPVTIPVSPDNGFHLQAADLERAITPRSRVLLLNTPNNPTGAVFTAQALAEIGAVCARHDLWILCDEVYAGLVYEGKFASPFDNPDLAERTVVVSSVSKSHAMTGFRCGWAVGSEAFSAQLLPLSETMLFGSQPFLEDATAFALSHDLAETRAMRDAYENRARIVVEHLGQAPGITCHMPEGGMFIMADIRATGLSGEAFALRLMEEEKVVTMPGEAFGDAGAGHLRISLTLEETHLAEACRRIAGFAARLMAA